MSEMDETDDDRIVAAVKEYMRMLDAGDAPTQDEFLRQHAEIADELRPSLEGLALVHQSAKPQSAAAVMAPVTEFPDTEFPDTEFTAQPIGDFRIVGELGRGGMGVVYEAVQLSLGRHVALKVLPFASGLDEIRLQRFRNEAHAAAALHHTNIVPVYAVGSDRGVHYYAMQMIVGSNLAELIDNMRATNADQHPVTITDQRGIDEAVSGDKRSIRSEDTVARHSTMLNNSSADRQRYFKSVVRMVHQAAVAIDHAHQYGVIHRDIKPANLLLDSVGKVWVTDFGLAQVQTEATQLTRTGDPMGTLRYMSPEQASGRRDELDHRTDIYSLGVTLYELLTLKPAITGDDHREMLNNLALHDPPSPRSIDPALPIELDTIVRKSIAKIPGERYASAGALADDLQAWLDDKPIAAKPPTGLERLAKWRRRNSGLVAVISGFLLLATLGLLATTLLIWEEQRQTREALDRETEQRQVAQKSFQQALDAVESFSRVSETELAYRPELQELRRTFLETSLEFYQDFLRDRADDPTLAKELESTSTRVKNMVEELRILESVSPLRALADRRVQSELGIEPEDAVAMEIAIDDFNRQRETLANQLVGGLTTENTEITALAREFNALITAQLSISQLDRLRQIVRQERLPFTFKTSEVVAALGLTREQRENINRIILETSPRHPGGKRGDGREGPGRGGPPGMGGPRGDGNGGPRFGGPPFEGPPPDGPRPDGPRPDGPRPDGPRPQGPPPNGPGGNHGIGDRQPLRFDRARSATTANTVAQILEILTPPQRATWKKLIGDPFEG